MISQVVHCHGTQFVSYADENVVGGVVGAVFGVIIVLLVFIGVRQFLKTSDSDVSCVLSYFFVSVQTVDYVFVSMLPAFSWRYHARYQAWLYSIANEGVNSCSYMHA